MPVCYQILLNDIDYMETFSIIYNIYLASYPLVISHSYGCFSIFPGNIHYFYGNFPWLCQSLPEGTAFKSCSLNLGIGMPPGGSSVECDFELWPFGVQPIDEVLDGEWKCCPWWFPHRWDITHLDNGKTMGKPRENHRKMVV